MTNVGQAQQILFGLLQLLQRLAAAQLVLGHARGFFEQHPPAFAVVAQNLLHHLEFENGVEIRTHAAVVQHVGDVLQTALVVVQQVFAGAVAEQPAGDFHFGIGNIQPAVVVLEHDLDFGQAGRLRCAVPLKITLSMRSLRRTDERCSPSTQRSESTTLDLPQPLGPTTQVMPGAKSSLVGLANDLNPEIESDKSCIILLYAGSSSQRRHDAFNISCNRLFSIFGLAVPPEAFIASPMKNPNRFFFPDR